MLRKTPLLLKLSGLCLLVASLVQCSGDGPHGGSAGAQNVGIAGNSFTLNGAKWVPKAFNIAGFVSTPAYLRQLQSQAKYNGYLADTACAQELFTAMQNFGADTVRVFVSQYFLNSNASMDDPYFDPDYFGDVVAFIRQARASGLVVEIAMQEEEESGGPVFHGLPTMDTLQNWRALNREFGDDQGVIYELYNEPTQGPLSQADWTVWRDGGTAHIPPEDKVAFAAIGMQEIVEALREDGSMNTIVVDGLALATTLNGVIPISDPLDRVGYGIHQYLKQGSVAQADWDANFGHLSESLPIFVDEWFACANTEPGLKGLDSYQPAVDFLNYLRAKGIGIGGWAFDVHGYMMNDIPDPTSPAGCSGWQQPSYYAGYSEMPPSPIGDAGLLIMNLFLTDYSRPLTLLDGTTLFQPPPSTYPPTPPYPTPAYAAIDCST